MMTLYSGTTCPYSQRCRIVLFEKGMDFQVIDVDLTNKPEDLAVINPYNRVPVLVERKRGITLRAATLHDQGVIESCRAIHAADPVPGCYSIQLIKAADGSAKPFEINPRVSTTACLGLAAGVDFIGIFLGLPGATDHLRQGLVDFKDRLGLKRSWHNEIVEAAGAYPAFRATARP